MADLYEAHITYEGIHRDVVEELCPPKWKFSAITGDPILGKGSYCYLTSYDSDAKTMLKRMHDVAISLGIRTGVTPARQKIEKIVFDTKSGRDEVT